MYTLFLREVCLGHSQINLRGGSSRVEFFSSKFTKDNICNVELDRDGMEMLIVGGSEECSVTEYLAYLIVGIFGRAFVGELTCILGLPLTLPLSGGFFVEFGVLQWVAPDIVSHFLVEYVVWERGVVQFTQKQNYKMKMSEKWQNENLNFC